MDSSDDASGGSCVVVSVVGPLALVMAVEGDRPLPWSFFCRWRRRWGNRPGSVVDVIVLSRERASPPLSAGEASSASGRRWPFERKYWDCHVGRPRGRGKGGCRETVSIDKRWWSADENGRRVVAASFRRQREQIVGGSNVWRRRRRIALLTEGLWLVKTRGREKGGKRGGYIPVVRSMAGRIIVHQDLIR